MIYGEEFVRTLFEEDVPALAICVITEQVEEHDGFEELPVVYGEVEVVIFDVIFNELLERTRAVGTVVAVENYGAGDLLEIERTDGKRALISFKPGIADLDGGRVVLDPEFLA